MTSTVVVALGGNALVSAEHESILDQLDAVRGLAPAIVDLVSDGWRVVVTHGNGPQVGYILRRSELALSEVAPVPIDFAVADTQGAIGHMFLLALRNELLRRGVDRRVTALVTDVIVDPDDSAFRSPTKPIGSHFDERRAKELAASFGWVVGEDAGRGWRRMVPSPVPVDICERSAVASLLDAGHVVIACGGGGIPLTRGADGNLARVEAVVDKDLTSALLAHQLSADTLVIITTVDQVAVGFGTPEQRWLGEVGVDEMRRHLARGEFAPGSMGPKVESAIRFLDADPAAQRASVITSAPCLVGAVRGSPGIGTRIVLPTAGSAPVSSIR